MVESDIEAGGNVALPSLVYEFLSGAPVRLTGMVLSGPTINFEVPRDSGVACIQDLTDKTIAVISFGYSSEAMAIRSIQNADGISLEDGTIKEARSIDQAIEAVMDGVADITCNVPPRSTEMLEKRHPSTSVACA